MRTEKSFQVKASCAGWDAYFAGVPYTAVPQDIFNAGLAYDWAMGWEEAQEYAERCEDCED
jgi:hypothetical protein